MQFPNWQPKWLQICCLLQIQFSVGNEGPCHTIILLEGLILLSGLHYSAVQCILVQCSSVKCRLAHGNIFEDRTAHFRKVQSSAVQCTSMQCSAIQCSAVKRFIQYGRKVIKKEETFLKLLKNLVFHYKEIILKYEHHRSIKTTFRTLRAKSTRGVT